MDNTARTCGSCTACCKTHMVQELEKPVGTWCTHCDRGKGCAIYATRPVGCKDFACLWLMSIEGEKDLPPHKSGIVPDMQILPTVGPTLVLYEYKAGTFKTSAWAKELRAKYLGADKPMAIMYVPVHEPPSLVIIDGEHQSADVFTLNGKRLRVRRAQRSHNKLFVPE